MEYRYLSIEGNIGAGKTSLSSRLADEIGARLILEEFADNPFLPKFYEDRERYAFPLELSFLAERYSQLKKELDLSDLFQKHIVSDYFLGKSLIFSTANLKGDEYELFSRMFHIIQQQLPKPDLLVYLYLSIEQLQKNIEKRGRDYERNISNDYLSLVQDRYMNFIQQQREMKVLIIDTNDLDFVNKNEDYQKLKEIIFQSHPIGIHRIKP